MAHSRSESENEGCRGSLNPISVQHHFLPAHKVAHVRVLLRLLGQILGLKRLQAHPDGH